MMQYKLCDHVVYEESGAWHLLNGNVLGGFLQQKQSQKHVNLAKSLTLGIVYHTLPGKKAYTEHWKLVSNFRDVGPLVP